MMGAVPDPGMTRVGSARAARTAELEKTLARGKKRATRYGILCLLIFIGGLMTIGGPDWFGIVVLLGLVWTGVAWMGGMSDYTESSTLLVYLEAGLEQRVNLVERCLAGQPFGFYLRDFDSERRIIPMPTPTGSNEYRGNPDADFIDGLFGDNMPLFGVLNFEQVLHGEMALITLDSENWFSKVRLYVRLADWIVIHSNNSGSNLDREIDWILEKDLGPKVLLIASEDDLKGSLARVADTAAWIIKLPESADRRRGLADAVIPTGLEEALSESAQRPLMPVAKPPSVDRSLRRSDPAQYCEDIEAHLQGLLPNSGA